jgi:hypothetical protein
MMEMEMVYEMFAGMQYVEIIQDDEEPLLLVEVDDLQDGFDSEAFQDVYDELLHQSQGFDGWDQMIFDGFVVGFLYDSECD